MLLDKGYYDYDYTEPKPKKKRNISKATDPDRLAKKLARLGIAQQNTPPTDDEIQAAGLEFLKRRKG